MADEVMVMKDGSVVEQGPTEAIFADPRELYTKALMAAALEGVVLDAGRQEIPVPA
jgi:oligopeptide transport system ATP-binding protein